MHEPSGIILETRYVRTTPPTANSNAGANSVADSNSGADLAGASYPKTPGPGRSRKDSKSGGNAQTQTRLSQSQPKVVSSSRPNLINILRN